MDNRIIYKKGSLVGKRYKSGMTFSFEIAVPSEECDKYALLLDHDGLNDANVRSMLRLAQEGNAPYCVCVGVYPAVEEVAGGDKYNRRVNSYDLFTTEYADFVVYELIPYIAEEYRLRFFDDPDMHYVSGGSSGGISAFLIAWFHPECFRRVYMSSPSFLGMGKGNEVPYLIRKCETKPLRVYQEYSEHEPDDYFGASYPINIEAKSALEYAGYDFACEFFPGEGHCSRYRDEETAYVRNKWIWRDYRDRKIVAPANPPRIGTFLSKTSVWEPADVFPDKPTPETELSDKYSHVVKSADGQFFYASDLDDDVVYAHPTRESASTDERAVHALLHTVPCIKPRGGIDIDVDVNDRLYVLTAIGIQCVRSFGLIDAIIDLPEGRPLEISVTDSIYVRTDCGIFKRALKPDYVNQNRRMFVDYYD